MSEESEMEKAWEYYERIRDALNGIFEILTMKFEEDDIMYKCALDNLEGLKEGIMDLLEKDYNPAEIKRKLREIEFNMKKCLFFDGDEKRKKESE
ncbi:MAG: hypothetical protein ACOC44_19660 [Promethearchaeia archaeon]